MNAEILAVGSGKDASLLISGARQVWNIPLAGKQWIADTTATGRSAVKDARFSTFASANLTADGAQNLVALDGVNDGIEVFANDAKNGFSSVASFRVLSDERLVSKGQGDRNAPDVREAVGGDFDNDGKGDLAVLCHDRLLMYKQEK